MPSRGLRHSVSKLNDKEEGDFTSLLSITSWRRLLAHRYFDASINVAAMGDRRHLLVSIFQTSCRRSDGHR